MIGREPLVDGVAEEAGVDGLDAVLDVRAQRGLEAARLAEAQLARRGRDVDGAVEDEAGRPASGKSSA